ncbi:MAG TPA: hypothetical protein VE961_03705 [Pyrinomonadaceae bacterium]|nr:hypothetical protein [Pyrinomonadaceae bacterium]
MTAALTTGSFAKLLARLDSDPQKAGDVYEELRRRLLRFFEWRSAPFPEEHADEVLNRLARKIDEGVIVQNVNSYAHEIARLVLLEAFKGPENLRTSIDETHFEVVVAPEDQTAERELRFDCLDECLDKLPADGRSLIVEYYREARDRINHRKEMSRRFGLNREALANRAQRLRDKLQQCVTRCLTKKSAI